MVRISGGDDRAGIGVGTNPPGRVKINPPAHREADRRGGGLN